MTLSIKKLGFHKIEILKLFIQMISRQTIKFNYHKNYHAIRYTYAISKIVWNYNWPLLMSRVSVLARKFTI